MNSARLRAYLMLLVVAVIWGIASPIVKFTLRRFDPLTFLTYRFGISSLLAVVSFAFFAKHIPRDRKVYLTMLLYGLLASSVSLGLLFSGLNKTTVLDSTLINLMGPLATSIAGVIYLKEKITKKEKLGMSLALLGTIVTILNPLLYGRNEASGLTGNLLIFASVFTAAAGAVLAKKLLRSGVDALTMTNFSFIVGFLSLLPFFLISPPPALHTIASIPLPYHLGVIYMAVFSGTLAYYLSNRAQKTIEISEASVFSYLYPIFSAPLAVIWLGERITSVFIIGAVIVAIGVLIAEYKPLSPKSAG